MANKSNVVTIKSDKVDAKAELNPMTGEIKLIHSGRSTGKSYKNVFKNNKITFEYNVKTVDYRKKFEDKREALHDMVADGDGFTREEIHDLVMTANRAALQESKESE